MALWKRCGFGAGCRGRADHGRGRGGPDAGLGQGAGAVAGVPTEPRAAFLLSRSLLPATRQPILDPKGKGLFAFIPPVARLFLSVVFPSCPVQSSIARCSPVLPHVLPVHNTIGKARTVGARNRMAARCILDSQRALRHVASFMYGFCFKFHNLRFNKHKSSVIVQLHMYLFMLFQVKFEMQVVEINVRPSCESWKAPVPPFPFRSGASTLTATNVAMHADAAPLAPT